jgi:hypothetical protein
MRSHIQQERKNDAQSMTRYNPPVQPYIKQIGIAGGTLAVVGIVAAALWSSNNGGSHFSPADVLPSQGTVALFAVQGKEDAAMFHAWFPLLQTPPEVTGPSWIAVMEQGRRRGWLLLRPTPEGSAEPFIITASDSFLLPLSQEGQRLSSDDAFRDVAPEMDGSWAYLAPGGAAKGILGGWIKTPAAVSLSLTPEGITLRLRDDERVRSATATPGSVLEAEALSFFSGNWTAVGTHLTSHTGEEPQLLWLALTQAMLQPLFGTELSFRHNLLPLLQNDGEVHIATGSGGQVRFALVGNAPSSDEAAKMVEQLRITYRSGSPAMQRERRDFEGGFAMDWLRGDTTTLQETEIEQEGGWKALLQSRSDGSHPLVTASAGKRFLLTNDPKLSYEKLQHGEVAAGPALNTQKAASGLIDPVGLKALFASLFPSNPPVLPFAELLEQQKSIEWSLDDDGRRITLTLRPL